MSLASSNKIISAWYKFEHIQQWRMHAIISNRFLHTLSMQDSLCNIHVFGSLSLTCTEWKMTGRVNSATMTEMVVIIHTISTRSCTFSEQQTIFQNDRMTHAVRLYIVTGVMNCLGIMTHCMKSCTIIVDMFYIMF